MKQSSQPAQLHVLVESPTRELCRVHMPLSALENLAQMVPDVDRARIESSGVDFQSVITRALSSGCRPQTLIEANVQERSYKFWIE